MQSPPGADNTAPKRFYKLWCTMYRFQVAALTLPYYDVTELHRSYLFPKLGLFTRLLRR